MGDVADDLNDMADGSAQPGGGKAPWVFRQRDIVLGWCISAALHAAVAIALLAVLGLGGGKPTEGGIVLDAMIVPGPRTDAVEMGAPGEIRLNPTAGAVAIPRMKEPAEVRPIWELGEAGPSPLAGERLIGIEVAGGGESSRAATKGDWTSFAAGGGGSGGGASFFGLEARGERFIFVVDRSGSMRGRKLEAAKAELLRAVRALERGSKFYTIFFNAAHTAMPSADLLRATEGNQRKHFEWVSAIHGDDGTDPTSAMKLALSMRPDAIWLLSDGLFRPEAVEEIRKANPYQKVQIHTIAYCSPEGAPQLQRIARENRGQYRFVPPESVGVKPSEAAGP